jgi:hypothetical protein
MSFKLRIATFTVLILLIIGSGFYFNTYLAKVANLQPMPLSYFQNKPIEIKFINGEEFLIKYNPKTNLMALISSSGSTNLKAGNLIKSFLEITPPTSERESVFDYIYNYFLLDRPYLIFIVKEEGEKALKFKVYKKSRDLIMIRTIEEMKFSDNSQDRFFYEATVKDTNPFVKSIFILEKLKEKIK